MRVVEIRRRGTDGETEVLARVSVPVMGGAAVIEPVGAADLDSITSMLSHVGVVDRRGSELQLSDGAAYLHALTQSLRGSRLFAAEVGPDDN